LIEKLKGSKSSINENLCKPAFHTDENYFILMRIIDAACF